MGSPGLISERLQVEETIEAVNDLFYERGWTDGLPIIPPTPDRVERMLSGRNSQEVVATLAPLDAPATIEKIAVNAVMAGCRPEYLAVVIAAVEAIAVDRFRLLGVQTTTHPCAPLIVVNGPVRDTLGINSRSSVFGPGTRANATIGRALRLVMINVGGAVPVKVDRSTHGSPAKYTYCIGENEEGNPWQPLHVERGFEGQESTVTVFAGEGPHNINDHYSTAGKGVLMTAAATMATAGNNNFNGYSGEPVLILSPEHAATIARDGFSKEDVKEFIFAHARVSVSRLPEETIAARRTAPDIYGEFADAELIPLCKREDIVVIVAGGEGKHSCFVPTFGGSYSVTCRIR